MPLCMSLCGPKIRNKDLVFIFRPLVRVCEKNLISQPKHMLWVLKRTVSMRRFFRAPKTYVKIEWLENIYNVTLVFLFI